VAAFGPGGDHRRQISSVVRATNRTGVFLRLHRYRTSLRDWNIRSVRGDPSFTLLDSQPAADVAEPGGLLA
jgi:hypothetical protein